MSVDLGERLVAHATALVQPLLDAAGSDDALTAICDAAGWNWSAVGIPLASVRTALGAVKSIADTLTKLAAQPDAQAIVDAAVAVMQVYRAVEDLGHQGGLAAGLPADALATFVGDLGGAILDAYFADQLPATRTAFEILGIYELAPAPALANASGAVARRAQRRATWDFAALSSLVTNPPAYARARFLQAGSGQTLAADALADQLGPMVARALARYGFSARYAIPGADKDATLSPPIKEVAAHVLLADLELPTTVTSSGALSFIAALADAPQGVALVLQAMLDVDAHWDADSFHAELKAAASPGAIAIAASGVSSPSGGPAPSVAVDLSATWGAPGSVVAQFGRDDSLSFKLAAIQASGGLAIAPAGTAWHAGLGVKGLQLALRANDGFLAQILPKDGVRATADLDLAWTSAKGLSIAGGAELSVTLPINLSFGGVLDIPTLEVGLGFNGKLEMNARTQLRAKIGPVVADVDGLGIGLALAPRAGGGFGSLDFAFAVLPPKGVGVSVDADVVKGGGYLYIDTVHHQYAGVGQLAIRAGVELTLDIVVIVTTDPAPAPDAPSYSLLVLASVEFSPGIALFGGFFLSGLGLLVGIQRAMDADVIRAGVKSGLISELLFPKDPVANAQQLISDLQHAFPVRKDRYVLGAMAKVSYGTGAAEIFTAELGFAVQIGGPLVLGVFGHFTLKWPRTEGDEILVLNLDCAGLWDSASKLISIDASLNDSRILTWPLTGDAAFRAGGPTNAFLLSVGGYHPHFQAPASFPHLDRLAITITAGSVARLRFETYTAITSNTFQIGARAEASIDLSVVQIEGHLAFDALLQFKPFHFEVDIDAGLTIKAAGITLLAVQVDLHVSGPNTWHVAGHLKLTILFFNIDVGFDTTFGDAKPAITLPTVDAMPLLVAAFQEPRACATQLASRDANLLSLATRAAPLKNPRIHPLATLALSQHELPLDLELDKLGASPLRARTKFSVTGATVSGHAQAITPVLDSFAVGQFVEMSDDDKLARPSFEPLHAGVQLASPAFVQSPSIAATVTYDTTIIDDLAPPPPGPLPHLTPVPVPTPPPAPAAPKRPVAVAAKRYQVHQRADLGALTTHDSIVQGQQAIRARVAAGASQHGDLQLLPTYEVSA